MTSTPTPGERNEGTPIWLWPGVAAVVFQWLVRFGAPAVVPEAAAIGMLVGLLGGLAVLVWWLFFSRVPPAERWGAVGLMILAAVATRPILHPSIATGMMGMMFPVSVIPGFSLALVVGALAGRRGAGPRRAALAAAILVACGFWTLLRTEGITGEGQSQWKWRWTKTAEQQLVARSAAEPAPPPAAAPALDVPAPPRSSSVTPAPVRATVPSPPPGGTAAEWPGFRGPRRDDVVTGVRIQTNWIASPPVELWRRPVGPGWSSFALRDGLLYTQEQRGDFEVVTCYRAATGEPVWTHRDAARFWESNGGAGPRATPAVHDGRVYAFGATGILNALHARTGAVVWSHNAASDAGAALPGWGFAGSPLVVDDLVVVGASGRLAAYERGAGALRWVVQTGGGSYSSPHFLTIGGVPQVVLMSGSGATSVAPADGAILWKHSWPGSAILQPAQAPDGGLLIASSDMSGGMGTRRLAVAIGSGGWMVEEVWTSRGLKPYFNDIVVHQGHAYGFDGGLLACIDLRDGKRMWKGGRYGHGQLLLLADQDLLLVLSEEGELALVAAAPARFREIARFPALEGKTWNHPVLAGDLLLVRNDREMAAFRLALAGA